MLERNSLTEIHDSTNDIISKKRSSDTHPKISLSTSSA
jgi:hypothetical protein